MCSRDGTSERRPNESGRAPSSHSRVPKNDIVAQDYDLSMDRYKDIVHADVESQPPLEIIADVEKLEAEITRGLADLKAMLS